MARAALDLSNLVIEAETCATAAPDVMPAERAGCLADQRMNPASKSTTAVTTIKNPVMAIRPR